MLEFYSGLGRFPLIFLRCGWACPVSENNSQLTNKEEKESTLQTRLINSHWETPPTFLSKIILGKSKTWSGDKQPFQLSRVHTQYFCGTEEGRYRHKHADFWRWVRWGYGEVKPLLLFPFPKCIDRLHVFPGQQ